MGMPRRAGDLVSGTLGTRDLLGGAVPQDRAVDFCAQGFLSLMGLLCTFPAGPVPAARPRAKPETSWTSSLKR